MHAALAVLSTATMVAAQIAPTVKISNGTIQGGKCASKNINYFLAIPYAQPPVGDARFTAPAPVDQAYNGTLDATKRAPACIQFGSQFVEYGVQSEDCLYLDIWAPANATSSSALPVKAWIYGGGNGAGGISDVLYDGCLSETEAVQVNINYRLGAMGWMALQGAGLTGNYGTQDQLLALQWIQENIGAFGGDKDKVMLYGQSAGAIDTYTIATLPQAKSLINTAIMESGAGTDIPTVAETQRLYELIATQLNCSVSDAACLRSKTPEEFNNTAKNLPNFGSESPGADTLLGHGGYGVEWGPVVDGVIVPSKPAEAGLKVPSIIGTATNEGQLFVLGTFGARFLSLNESDYDLFLKNNFGSVAPAVNASYPITNFDNVYTAMATVITDYGYLCPTYRALLSAEPDVPVYTYMFNHTPSCTWINGVPQAVLPFLGATHTSELPFVFGIFSGLPGSTNCTLSTAEQKLSLDIQTAWTQMAASGQPGNDWPQFSANTSKGVIYNDTPSIGAIDYSMCDFWQKIDNQVQQVANASATANGTQTGTGTGTGTAATPTKTNGSERKAKHFGLFTAATLINVYIFVFFF